MHYNCFGWYTVCPKEYAHDFLCCLVLVVISSVISSFNIRVLFKADSLTFGQSYECHSVNKVILEHNSWGCCRVIVSNRGIRLWWYRHICQPLHTRGLWIPATFIVPGLAICYSLQWSPLKTLFPLLVLYTEGPLFMSIRHITWRHALLNEYTPERVVMFRGLWAHNPNIVSIPVSLIEKKRIQLG